MGTSQYYMMRITLILTTVIFQCIFPTNSSLSTPNTNNFPYLSSIPQTGFKCSGKTPGYYADDHPLARCQVFHYCHHDGRLYNFLCPNSTIFNQKYFACDHYFNFDCSTAKDFYNLNKNLFVISMDDDGSDKIN